MWVRWLLGRFRGRYGYALGWCRCWCLRCRRWHIHLVVIVGLYIGCEIKWDLCYYYQQYLTAKRNWSIRIRWCCHPSYHGMLCWFCGCWLVIYSRNRCGHMRHVSISTAWGWGGDFWYDDLCICHCSLLLDRVFLPCILLLFMLVLLVFIWDWILLAVSTSIWSLMGCEDKAFASWLLWNAVCSTRMS